MSQRTNLDLSDRELSNTLLAAVEKYGKNKDVRTPQEALRDLQARMTDDKDYIVYLECAFEMFLREPVKDMELEKMYHEGELEV